MTDLVKLNEVVNELEEQSKDLKAFTEAYSEIGSLKEEIAECLRLIHEHNKALLGISSEVQKRTKESEKQLGRIESSLLAKIQELYQDNKKFQKDLDETLVSRLDKHKSDIQVEIRNEGAQIQRAFETSLVSNFNMMESKLNAKFESQIKQLNTLKALLFVAIGASIALGIGLFLK